MEKKRRFQILGDKGGLNGFPFQREQAFFLLVILAGGKCFFFCFVGKKKNPPPPKTLFLPDFGLRQS